MRHLHWQGSLYRIWRNSSSNRSPIPGYKELQEILKLLQVEKNDVKQDIYSCEGLESSAENDMLLLKENVDSW